jgi:hypothetical protein
MKVMSRKIWGGGFMRFFPKGLNSFKIQISFKLDFLLNFIIQNPEGFGNWAKNESGPFWSNL